jgi:transposase InsO family protein
MSWKVACAMEERFRFIKEYETGELDFAELCRRYAVSRKTGYKWLARYEEGGLANLADRSRAPHIHPNQVSEEWEERVIALRSEHPRWGPKKLWHVLAGQHGGELPPARSTMAAILQRHGLSWARKRKRSATPSEQPLSHAQAANQVWCTDYKGWFLCGDGQRCYPLTLTDAASRYLLRCQGLSSPDEASSRSVFEAAFREFGLPQAMRSDNGTPFASTGLHGLSKLSVWWLKLGIRLERIEPGEPQQNGRHERMHRTLKEETTQPAARTLRQQQYKFDSFRQEYNERRPHEALQFSTPASHYSASLRPYPARLPSVEYPGHFEQRKVDHSGDIKWNYSRCFLGRALTGERVGLEEINDGLWRVWFAQLLLGEFAERIDAPTRRRRAQSRLRLRSPSGLPPPEPTP